MNSNILRALTVCAALFVCLLAFSCGKGKPASTSTALPVVKHSGYVDWNGRHVKPLSELLDELDSLQMPSGVDPQEWAALKDGMRTWLNETFGKEKAASKYPSPPAGPPTPDYVKARDLSWTHEDGNTWGKLTWRYVNDGDYNEDGVVGVSDQTLLAMHLGETALLSNSVQELIDEDAETGQPNGDLVVDGPPPYQSGSRNDQQTQFLNFGVDVASYEILGSVDGSTWVQDVGEVLFSERLDPSDERDVFEWSIPNGNYKYYKVRALSFDSVCWERQGLIVESDACAVPPPTITDVSPKRVHPGVQVEFSAYLNSFPGTITDYDWQFNVRGVPYYFDVANPEITFPVTEDQSYDVYTQVRVSSQFGYSYPRPYYYFTVTVTKDGIPPSIVSVTPPSVDGEDGDEVSFEAEVDGDPPFAYAWDFGDGATPNTSSSATPTVNLANPGPHEGTLIVTNSVGSDEAQIPIAVHGWVVSELVTGSRSQINNDICMSRDQNDEPGISFRVAESDLKYITRVDGEWQQPETVIAGVEIPESVWFQEGRRNSLAFNKAPTFPQTPEPVIAAEYIEKTWGWIEDAQRYDWLTSGQGTRFARKTVGGWVVQMNVPGSTVDADPSVAFQGSTPFVSCYRDMGAFDLMLLQEISPGIWEDPPVIVDDGGLTPHGLSSSLSIFGSQKVIAYRCVTITGGLMTTDVRLMRYTNMVAEPSIIEAALPGDLSSEPLSLALSASGQAWVAYGASFGLPGILKVARESIPPGGPWDSEPIDLEGSFANYPSIAFSPNGSAGLAYVWRLPGTSSFSLKFRWNISGEWEAPNVVSANVTSCSLAFTEDNQPSIAFVTRSGETSALNYAERW